MSNWLFIICAISLIFSVLSFIAAVGCIAYTIGLRNSTHQISYVPLGGNAKDNNRKLAENEEDEQEELEELDNF